ncbi:InlB B-repeat-containing protein [Enterococcus wangshanyuanii]
MNRRVMMVLMLLIFFGKGDVTFANEGGKQDRDQSTILNSDEIVNLTVNFVNKKTDEVLNTVSLSYPTNSTIDVTETGTVQDIVQRFIDSGYTLVERPINEDRVVVSPEGTTITYYFEKGKILQIFYLVTFNSNGGSSVLTQKIKENELLLKPVNPQKEGFYFGGWYLNKELSEEWNFETPIIEDTILYAKWIKKDDLSENHYQLLNTPDPHNKTKKLPKLGQANLSNYLSSFGVISILVIIYLKCYVINNRKKIV